MPFGGSVVMILVPAVLGLVLARSADGLRTLPRAIARFRALELLVAAALVKAAFASGLIFAGGQGVRAQVALAVALGIAFVWLNRDTPVPGARAALVVGGLGALANAVVQLIHGGMVFSTEAALAAGYSVEDVEIARFGYVPLVDGNLLGLLLGDVIPVPVLHRVLSVGDLVLMLGITMLARSLASRPATEPPADLASTTHRVVDPESGEEVSG